MPMERDPSASTARSDCVRPPARIDIAWPLATSAHWYDVTLTSDHDKRYVRRLAGHVENGQPSTSDPAYGVAMDRIFGGGFE